MLQDDAVTYSKIQNVGGNSILARAASGSGNLSEVSLSASQLLGRGSSGNIAPISLSGLTMVGTTLTSSNTGTVTNVASGNGMNFSTITGSGTVTMGTPSTLTGSSTNATTSTSHTHALDFGTFLSNSRVYYMDTSRTQDGSNIQGGMAVNSDERVVAFTQGEEIDSTRLTAGYYTITAKVLIAATNQDSLVGTAVRGGGVLPIYRVKVYVTDDPQVLGGAILSQTTIESGNAFGMMPTYRDVDGNPIEGTVYLTLTTTPAKVRISDGQFICVTLSCDYGGIVDWVADKQATMVVERSLSYESTEEQLPENN